MRSTRSQIRAAQIAALAAEQEAYEKSVKDAIKVAAFARCDAVEQLYELLNVKPQRPITREGKNGPYEVATDKDEVKRSARLIDAVSKLVTAAESHQSTSPPLDTGRGSVHAAAHAEAMGDQRFPATSADRLVSHQPAN